MNVFSQFYAATRIGLTSIPHRWGASSVIVIGITGVVAVLISVLAMAEGFAHTIASTGRPDRAVVLRSGSTSELPSVLSREAAQIIMDAPGVKRDVENRPIASAEAVVLIEMKSDSGASKNVTMRGVSSQNYALRPEIKLVAGRTFTPGTREIIVGSAAQSHFKTLAIGRHVAFREGDWTVVGSFESHGDSHESELLADADTLMSAYHRTQFQSVTVRLESPQSLQSFKDALTVNPTISVTVLDEPTYYAQQSERLSATLTFVAYGIGGLMALGAVFGALNTMYSAVSARAREIATLRAIGFSSGSIVASVLVEALILALLGSFVGAALTYIISSGNTISTFAGGSNQVVFRLTVTAGLVAVGIAWACVIGLVGGVFPALHAARGPISVALRAA